MNLEAVIKNKLEATNKNCEYKKTYIPKGWAHVKIDKFSEELARDIGRELKEDKHASNNRTS